MPLRKMHKKEFRPKMKDKIGDTIHHGKTSDLKVKYNHKNHWLEEEELEVAPYRMKKKKKKR